MNGMHLVTENTLIKTISDMVQGKVDAIGIGFEHRLSNGDLAFKNQFDLVVELFQETLNAIESIVAIPVNPFVSTVFFNWVNNFDVTGINFDVSRLTKTKSGIEIPQYLACQVQVSQIRQPHGKAFEMEIRMSLINKDSAGKNAWLYPIMCQTFVLSQYQGDMRV
jgi:hypothetical protein